MGLIYQAVDVKTSLEVYRLQGEWDTLVGLIYQAVDVKSLLNVGGCWGSGTPWWD